MRAPTRFAVTVTSAISAIVAVGAAACLSRPLRPVPEDEIQEAGGAFDAGAVPDADAGSGDADAGARGDADAGDADADAAGALALTSTALTGGAAIPITYTCSGNDVSPPLAWSGAPPGTQSYAVVMRDLTLGGANNYHWVIYDIPAAATSLPEGVQGSATPAAPAGAKQTQWSFGPRFGYGGPCPPPGTPHTYEISLYSFASPTLAIPAGTTDPGTADAVIQAQKTASATLTGTFQR